MHSQVQILSTTGYGVGSELQHKTTNTILIYFFLFNLKQIKKFRRQNLADSDRNTKVSETNHKYNQGLSQK